MARNHSRHFDSFDSFDSPRLSRSFRKSRNTYAFAIYSRRGDCIDFGRVIACSESRAMAKVRSDYSDSIPPRAQIIIHLDSES